jgi:hypothetical protein
MHDARLSPLGGYVIQGKRVGYCTDILPSLAGKVDILKGGCMLGEAAAHIYCGQPLEQGKAPLSAGHNANSKAETSRC